jgi:hypothetical protein
VLRVILNYFLWNLTFTIKDFYTFKIHGWGWIYYMKNQYRIFFKFFAIFDRIFGLLKCCNPSVERVWGWRLTLPSELLFWELESRLTLKPLESNYRGQNTSHWGVFYVIGKLFKCRCLKWARMTYLDICNTNYGKKKNRESNWFDVDSSE